MRVEREEKGPGLKPLDSKRLIQGAEAPCSLRRSKGKGARFVGERGGGLRRARVRRGSSTSSGQALRLRLAQRTRQTPLRMTDKKQAKANAGVLRCAQDDKQKTGNGISRGLKPVSSGGGIGLPRLKPGPISEAKANAGVLRCAQDDSEKQTTAQNRQPQVPSTSLRTGSSTASGAKNAPNFAQDDSKNKQRRKTSNRRFFDFPEHAAGTRRRTSKAE